MKTISTLLLALALLPQSFIHAMDEAPIVISKIFSEPNRDTQEMSLSQNGVSATYHVDRNVVIDINHIENATANLSATGSWTINLSFNEEGTSELAALTKECIGKPIAIRLDGKLVSAPVVRAELTGGAAQITGDFDQSFAEDFARRINQAAAE